MDEVIDLEGLDDFELEQPLYQVWAIGYEEDKQTAGLEVLINECRDPDKAVEYAKKYIIEERFKTLSIPDDVHYLSIEVEEVVDGGREDAGAIFQDGFKIR